MAQPLQPTLWSNNTYLIASLCALRLFTPFCPNAVAHILSANFIHADLECDDVRYIWETIAAEHPPWLEDMAALRDEDPRVAVIIAMLVGQALAGNVPLDGEEMEGLDGVWRSMRVMLGIWEGAW